jgi:hypothetical protein
VTKIEALLELVCQLPKGLRSDWSGTNHFELTQPNPDAGSYWWFDGSEISYDGAYLSQDSELGRRLGLLMDIAEAAKAAEGELMTARRVQLVYGVYQPTSDGAMVPPSGGSSVEDRGES